MLAAASAAPRLFNLGAASMWHDEILITQETSGSLGDYWRVLQKETYPPLDGFLTWMQLQAGVPEVARRLLPVLLGVLTILLLARWASETLGRRAAWAFGLLAAFSPIHVHYSQELRPYSLGLFWVAASLWSFHRVERDGSRRAWVALAVSLLGCLYTHYFAAVIFAVLAALALDGALLGDPESRARGRRLLPRLAILAGVVAVGYLPWVPVARTMTSWYVIKEARTWTLTAALQRIEHLTTGGLEGDPATWRVWLPLALAAIGAAAAVRLRAGRALLVGALAGTVGVEILLWAEEHWSNDRYSLFGWPFLCLLMALGAASLGRLAGRRPKAATAVTLLVVAAQIALQLPRLERDYQRGRPHWRWMAETVATLVRPGDMVIAANEWTQRCLAYYADRLEPPERRYAVVQAADLPPGPPGPGCRFLVAGGWPSPAGVIRSFAPPARLASDPGGLGAHLYRLTPYDDETSCVWMPPADRRWRPPAGVAALLAPAPGPLRLVLDFDPEGTGPHLLDGWSRFEADEEGEHFVWAVGERALLALGGLPPERRTLTLDLWTLGLPDSEQRVEVALNGEPLREAALPGGASRLAVEVAEDRWRPDENLLAFRFARTVVPAELDPANPDDRELAAAFRRLALEPSTGKGVPADASSAP